METKASGLKKGAPLSSKRMAAWKEGAKSWSLEEGRHLGKWINFCVGGSHLEDVGFSFKFFIFGEFLLKIKKVKRHEKGEEIAQLV